MLMTEEEARTKACPKALAPDSYSETFAVNRERDEVHSSCRCIASGCMAWRLESEEDFEVRYSHWEDGANLGPDVTRGPEPQRRGYCGALSRPEA